MLVTERTNLLTRAIRRPEGFLLATFAVLILVGTLLLSLPIAHAPHTVLHPTDALFTATSAVCVTGLIVVDTGHDFSLFGQIVILFLIQFGGLGIMTFAALVAQIVGHKISFRSQAALYDVFYQQNAAMQFQKHLKWILGLALTLEAVGTVLLFVALPDDMGTTEAAYFALFHAVSAFCNAGFSLSTQSLIPLQNHALFMTTIAFLIVLGGLGYTVLLEVIVRSWRRVTHRPNPVVWSLNTRVVLQTTLILILIGAIFFDVFGLSANDLPDWRSRAGNALFQSITARTAGFNTVDISALETASLLWLVLLMFVGGSPGSCAGGVKTTTLAIWVARLKARLRQREDVTIAGRRIPSDLIRRTGLLVGIAAVYNLVGILFLSITEMGGPQAQVRLEDIVFEQISAFATVGLSTGLTPALSLAGKLWIILTMFVGRLGPLTIALVVMERQRAVVRLPQERLMIG